MSPRTEQQFEKIRETRKKEIMDTSIELFASEGFHSTSISMIAKKAGISKGLIYNYFDSKEDLIREIIFSGIDQLTQFVDINHDGVLSDDELKFFLEKLFKLMRSSPHYWLLYFSLFLQPQIMKLVEKRLGAMMQIYIGMMISYFAARGSVDPEVDARMFLAMLDGLGFQFIMDPDHFPTDKILNKLISTYC